MYMKAKNQSVRDSNIIFVVNPKLKEFPQLQPRSDKNGIPDKQDRITQSHSNILRVYFWFAYHLCICPFQIVKEADGSNVARKWIIQMVSKFETLKSLKNVCLLLLQPYGHEYLKNYNGSPYLNIIYKGCMWCHNICGATHSCNGYPEGISK